MLESHCNKYTSLASAPCIEFVSQYFKAKHHAEHTQPKKNSQKTCLACYFSQCFLKLFLFFQKMLHLV